MKTIFRYLIGILLIALLAGCGPLTPMPPVPSQAPSETQQPQATNVPEMVLPALTGDWHVSLTRSGGIMGATSTLDISSDGKMTLTDMSGKKVDKGSLTADELTTLSNLAAAAQYFPAGVPSNCADCISLLLVVSNKDEKFQVQLFEPDLPASGLQPLVEFLTKHMQ